MRELKMIEKEKIKAGNDWPGGTICYISLGGWLSSRTHFTRGVWNYIVKECYNS